jgi:ribosome-binding protein aMBF1 (putative translation factor)
MNVQEIQEAFVSIRKTATTLTDADKAMSQEDLSQRLQLARLLGLRLGKDEVDLDDWQQACKLEKLRKIRLSTK